MANEMLTPDDISQFRALFSKYCRGEINANRCEADSCEYCPVNRAYEEIDEQLHREYEASLRMIKRRLKLEPDCSDTIWDRDYRHPIDIRRMLQERFDRCAPRAAQGDYTIDFI